MITVGSPALDVVYKLNVTLCGDLTPHPYDKNISMIIDFQSFPRLGHRGGNYASDPRPVLTRWDFQPMFRSTKRPIGEAAVS